MSRRCSIKVCCAGFCIVDSLYGAAESGHVQVAAGGPVVGGDVPDLAVMGIKALPSSGKLPATRALLRVSRFSRPNHGVRADAPAMLHRIAFQQACGGLAGHQVHALQPRAIWEVMKFHQLVASSFIPSVTPITSR